MSFLARLLGGDKRAFIGDYSTMGNPSGWLKNWFSGGRGNASGKEVSPQTALSISAIYRGIGLRSETKAMLPLNLYKSRKKDLGADLVEDGPLGSFNDMLCNVWNQHYTRYQAIKTGAIHRDLRGNTFYGIQRDGNFNVQALYPITPERVVRFAITEDGRRAYWIVPPGGGDQTFVPQENMLHIPGGASWDGLFGVSIIHHGEQSIGSMIGMEEHLAAQWKNAARVGGILKTDGVMKRDVYDRLKQDFQELYTGSSNAWKTTILEDGIDFQKVSMSAEELQMVDTKKLTIADVSRWLNVPPPLLYHTEGMNFNSLEQLALMWATYSVLPELVCWEQQMNKDLLTADMRKKGYFVKFDHKALEKADMRTRFFRYTSGLQWGILNRDEVRDMEDMNPLPDDLGKQYLTPLNMVPLIKNPDENAPNGSVNQNTSPLEGQPAPKGKSKNPADNAPQNDQKQAAKAAFLPIFTEKLGQIATKQSKFVANLDDKLQRGVITKEERNAKCDEFFKTHSQWMRNQLATSVQSYCQSMGFASMTPMEAFTAEHLTPMEAFTVEHCTRALVASRGSNFVGLNRAEEANRLMELWSDDDET